MVAAPIIGAFVFLVIPSDALAASYCGQTSGSEQGGIVGNQATVTITTLADGQHVTNPNVTVAGAVNSNPLGRSWWGIPDNNTSTCTLSPDGNDIVDKAEISNVNVNLNGTYMGNCSDSQVNCTRNADWSHADYSRALVLRPGANTINIVVQHGYNQWIGRICNDKFGIGIGYACQLGTRAAPANKTITVTYDPPGPSGGIPNGQIIGRCVGWPSPHVEIEWSRNPPPGANPPNSNSILRAISTVNGGGQSWFYGGGNPPPGVWATRINGSPASPVGPGGYPNPNFSVYDLRDDSVKNFIGSTFTYRAKYRPETPSSNTYSVTIDAASCGGPPPSHLECRSNACVSIGGPGTSTCTSNANCVPTHLECRSNACVGVPGLGADLCTDNPSCAPSAGTIQGTCTWVGGRPQVNLTWSQSPPPNSGAANSNGLQKGDSYPNDPQRFWEFLNVGSSHAYTDSVVQEDAQYQYRVKYRPDLTSVNTYNIFTSAANCGGPAPTPEPLVVRPSLQTIPPNVTAFLTATGGSDNSYTWSAPGGTITGAGPRIGVAYTNGTLNPVRHTVTVHSGTQVATAEVEVEGVETFQDDIDLIARGNRFILINGDAAYTVNQNVSLTLSHGFPGVADSDVRVRLSNTLEGVTTAQPVPFQSQRSWDICAGLPECSEGLYHVFAIFMTSGRPDASVVLDMITYLNNPPTVNASIVIDGGAASTSDRFVDLALQHGFTGIPEDEISVQLANDPALVDTATPVVYGSFYPNWSLCAGLGSICPNGQKFVYAKYCARGQCNPTVSSVSTLAVRDDILLDSPWPDWGVTIDGNAVTTDKAAVQLALNPWFNIAGTEVYVSNMPDMLDAVAQPWTDLITWDICYNRASPCDYGDYTVYVKYLNDDQNTWPGAESPVYQDDIAYTAPLPPPPPGDAAILINGGAPTTDSRFVTVNFNTPWGTGPGIQMRPVNEGELTKRDALVIANVYAGGIDSQPETRATPPPLLRNDVSQPAVDRTPVPGATQSIFNVLTGEPDPSQFGKDLPELESGFARPFALSLAGWDLCQGAVDCPFGKYKIYVQYYLQPGALTSLDGTLAALGDQISMVYFDTIDYGAPTPTPSVTPTPTPTGSVVPTPTGTAGPTPTGTPGIGGPPGTPCGFFCSIFGGGGGGGILGWFADAFSGSEPVLGPLALVSAIVVALSALLTILPLIGPGLLSFLWQWFLGAMGLLPARKKTWGTVYDSNTKRPIPYAKVQLLDRGRRVLETRVADKEGRYGFLTTPESLQAQNVQIYLLPTAPGYAFPSHAPVTIDTFVYNNLYRGDLITVDEKTLINFDIPMDPLKPQTASLMRTSPSIAMGAVVAAMADAGFWLGLIIVPLNFLVNPNPFTFGTLCLFLGTASLRLFGISEHPFGAVTDAQTGHAMPFALITLNDMSGKRVAFAVSDEQGRYFMVVQHGSYELSAFTPATIQPTRQSKQVIEVKRGWVTRSIKV